MIGIWIGVALFVVGFVLLLHTIDKNASGWDSSDTAAFAVGYCLVAAVLLFPFTCFLVVPMTGGLCDGYAKGESVGYIVDVNKCGIIWKTTEVRLQSGTGQQAALEGVYRCSTVDDFMAQTAVSASGRKVKITYRQWLIQPFWKGSSGRDIEDITILDEEK